jgi:non-ribosomal peptide synthase protein (TIGR01720 family)
MHHLVSDGHSWALLREDIGAAYAALTSGAAPRLPAKTTSFRRWARELEARKDTDAVTAAGLEWRHRARRLRPLPTDLGDRDENRFGSVASVEISLTSSEVSDLVRSDVVAQGSREASLVDRLLGALAVAVARWTASDAVGIDVSTHARDPRLLGLDVSRTLGYFTAISPIVVLVPTGGTPQMAVASASAEMERRGLGGLAYGLLRHSSRDDALAREVRGARQPEIAFHYLGHRPRHADHEGAAFRVVASSVRPRQDPRERRPYLLEVVATGTEDGIELELGYSTCLYRADSIERLAAEYRAALAAIARV